MSHGAADGSVPAGLSRTAVALQTAPLPASLPILPSAALAELERFAEHLPGANAATVCVVTLDPTTGLMHYCTAGHPPPLVVDADGHHRYLVPTGGGPLGTSSAYAAERDQLADGEVLLLYTDGAVSRPERHPARAAAELAEAAVGTVRGHRSATAAAQRACAGVCHPPCVALARIHHSRSYRSLL